MAVGRLCEVTHSKDEKAEAQATSVSQISGWQDWLCHHRTYGGGVPLPLHPSSQALVLGRLWYHVSSCLDGSVTPQMPPVPFAWSLP